MSNVVDKQKGISLKCRAGEETAIFFLASCVTDVDVVSSAVYFASDSIAVFDGWVVPLMIMSWREGVRVDR